MLAPVLSAAALASAALASGPTSAEDRATVLVVVGAPGEEEYRIHFEKWSGLWEKASHAAGAKFISIGLEKASEAGTDRELLKQALAAESAETVRELWLVLLGHGTYDGTEAKFNLRGPDVTATDLATWLKEFRRPLAIIDCASASGPFINKLSGTNRVVIAATRSGYEQNYARFGGHLAEAIADPQADLDKDGQTSLLEAFLLASRRVAEFYNTEGRLATEHALVDDNGDGLGTPADWFRGTRAVKKAREGASADGLRAHQFHLVRSAQELKLSASVRRQRDELERAIDQLRESKSGMKEDEYYGQLEKLFLELARLYDQTE